MVFAPDSYREPSGQFYRDMTTSYRLPGLSHLDNFIVTRKSCPLTGPDSYRDLQKLMPTLTRTATHTTGPLAFMRSAPIGANSLISRQIRNDEIGTNANGQKQIFNGLSGLAKLK